MRTLHVAAMPFPSPQGTQGLLHAMLSALARAGHDTHLVCYGYGSTLPRETPYRVHRLAHSLGLRSLRSGPGLRKLALDLVLAGRIRSLVRTLRPDLVVAHHVEAAGACALARAQPFVFVAHTSLRDELPSYFPASFAALFGGLGRALDRQACGPAERVLSVSPLLSQRLAESAGAHAQVLSVPWPVPPAFCDQERRAARAKLGFAPDERVVLYAGNLDRYQGLPVLAQALARLVRRDLRWKWLVATASGAEQRAALSGLPWLRFAELASEHDRRIAHAAADVVAVPRGSAGGLPIKLLDALARGAHVVATRRACAGLSLEPACAVVEDDDPRGFADALETICARDRPISNAAAQSYIRSAHSDQAFLQSFFTGLAAAPA